MLLPKVIRKTVSVSFQILTDGFHLLLPLLDVDREQCVHRFLRDIQVRHIDITIVRQEADRCLLRADPVVTAVDYPAQHSQILAEAGPQELAVLVLAEPVDVEDFRQVFGRSFK